MQRLSKPLSELSPRYDALVVGSGYGGGVAASRLARMGYKAALLERGREILPGEYPDIPEKAVEQSQAHARGCTIGSKVSADMVALAAESLGSTEILLKSKASGLSLSDALGSGFRGNADVLAFGYNKDAPIDGISMGWKAANYDWRKGPSGRSAR